VFLCNGGEKIMPLKHQFTKLHQNKFNNDK